MVRMYNSRAIQNRYNPTWCAMTSNYYIRKRAHRTLMNALSNGKPWLDALKRSSDSYSVNKEKKLNWRLFSVYRGELGIFIFLVFRAPCRVYFVLFHRVHGLNPLDIIMHNSRKDGLNSLIARKPSTQRLEKTHVDTTRRRWREERGTERQSGKNIEAL